VATLAAAWPAATVLAGAPCSPVQNRGVGAPATRGGEAPHSPLSSLLEPFCSCNLISSGDTRTSSSSWQTRTPLLEIENPVQICRRLPPTKQTTTTRATHARRTNPRPSSAMQTPAAPASYVVRLSGALAALLGDVELPEDELLAWLRAQGLITYPSPLLEGLLGGELPQILAAKVLPQLDPIDIAMFGRVGPASRAVVVASGLPRAGATVGVPLQLEQFVGSAERLAW